MKGIIFVGGHFGNREYMGGAVSSKGYPVGYVVAAITNPYIEMMINDHREGIDIDILEKHMSIRGIFKSLRSRRSLAMLIDPDAGWGPFSAILAGSALHLRGGRRFLS